MGDKIVVQGGTFNNNAILRAFELVSEKEVVRPDIAGIMGAFGAALIARERAKDTPCDIITKEELESFSYNGNLIRCKGCSNQCRLTVTKFKDGRSFISGNRCEKGAGLAKEANTLPHHYKYKNDRLFT